MGDKKRGDAGAHIITSIQLVAVIPYRNHLPLCQSIATTGAKITVERDSVHKKPSSIAADTMAALMEEKEDRDAIVGDENMQKSKGDSDVILSFQDIDAALIPVTVPLSEPVSIPLSGPVAAAVLPVSDLAPLADPSPCTASAPWVPCCLCGLDCTWVYIMHSDASRALVTHRCK